MKLFFLSILLSFLFPQLTFAEQPKEFATTAIETDMEYWKQNDSIKEDSLTAKQFRNMKITAVTLAVTLGVFGVHRLYLGTSPRIPITYTLTLGGGFFVLPVIDIVYILSAKDSKQLQNNTSIFIWNKMKKGNL